MSEYKTLIAELTGDLETMAKSGGCDTDDKKDDKKIEAAAADGEKISDRETDGDDKEKDGKDEKFGKAFKVTMADGTETEAVDGTELLKAIQVENGELREHIEDIQKAFATAVGVIKQLRTEMTDLSTMTKSMQSKVAAAGAAGTGRRTMVAIAEKLTSGISAEPTKPTANGVMMKAQQMCQDGKLPWEALPRIEAFQGRGQIAPPDILARWPALLTPLS